MIRSPSSSRTTRRTPCVDGCCGPMLRIISSAWIGPSTTTSTPPPRTIHASDEDEYAVRSRVSIARASLAEGPRREVDVRCYVRRDGQVERVDGGCWDSDEAGST